MDRTGLTNFLLTVVALFVIGLVLKFTQPVILTILIAVLLAYIMDPLVSALKKKKVPLGIGVLLSALIFLTIILGIGFALYQSSLEFAGKIPIFQERFLAMIDQWIARIPFITGETIKNNILAELENIPIGSTVFAAVGSIAGFLTNFLLVFFFSLLYLYGKYHITRKILHSFPGSRGKNIAVVLFRIDTGLRQYIGIKTLTSASIGVLTWICLLLFQVEFSTILGFLTFILNFIPYLGSAIAVLLPALIALIQFGSPALVLWLLLILLILQNGIAYLLEPRLVGQRLNMSVPIVFFSLLFWGWLWGAAGVILAVPVTTSIKIVLGNIPDFKPFALMLERAPKRRPTKPGR
ncbi:MAG TPA: AI-2E family transporter [bacterium]|nr:AI-2E family transporter [bacterium]